MLRLTLLVLPLGAALFAGCAGPPTALTAKTGAPSEKISSIATIQKAKLATPVTVRGAMVEKCPVAGCWFKIHDATGTIKIDAKAAGFTVTDVPLQTQFTVRGKVMPNGSEKMIQATSADY